MFIPNSDNFRFYTNKSDMYQNSFDTESMEGEDNYLIFEMFESFDEV